MKNFEKYLTENNIRYQKNVPLAHYFSTRVGGVAKYFVECSTEKSLIAIFRLCHRHGVISVVVGGGSNLLVSDDGVDGVVILNKYKGIGCKGRTIKAKSGTRLFDLVKYVSNKNFSGMDKLLGIPGTVGGALYGNAGAYGESTSDHLKRVKIFDGEKVLWLDKNKCGYKYRESIFKKTKPLILEAKFNFEVDGKFNVKAQADKILKERNKKYSADLKCPGSFFKNVEISKISKEILRKIPKENIIFDKIPAGYLLESVGAKGRKKGKIKVSDFHSNFFINTGDGKAEDFYNLAMELQKDVYKKFGIELEPEVQLVGFNNINCQKVAILGFGLEGRDLINYLLSKNAAVTVFDRKEKEELDLSGIDNNKVKLVCGPKYLKNGLKGFDIIYRSPGVYRFIPEILEAEKSGVKVSSAIKLFFAECPANIIGVTGTKGKGTTSTLIYEILKKAGINAFLAGNIGKPFLELLSDLKKTDWVVLELSSFQLIDLGVSPHIGVILNITEDHLDWHKDKNEYIEAKTNILKYQSGEDCAVINHDYKLPRSFKNYSRGKVLYFSRLEKVNGCYVKDGNIYLNIDKKFIDIGSAQKLLLRGRHNWENITAAILSSYLAGADTGAIKEVVFSFKGLEHRLELVDEKAGIRFYNDSFATGPQPTIAAINSFEEPLTLILGGYDKGLDYKDLIKEITSSPNLKNVILIGDLQKKLSSLLTRGKYQGNLIKLGKPKIGVIVSRAFKITPRGGVVLLSPAAASFDMFSNYKERGKKFKEAVREL